MTIITSTAEDFIPTLEDGSVELILTDPPFYGIVSDDWDNQWESSHEFSTWLSNLLLMAKSKLTPTGSLVFFAGIGKHGIHPLFEVVNNLELGGYTYRNWITWKKRRAYGKSHDYLYCREEILWFNKSTVRTEVTFNIPLLSVKRGYDGFNPKYKAKSEYKRVSNVWDDIPELMRTKRSCEKPLPLIERLVLTHSNPGDLVVDFFAGLGPVKVICDNNERKFLGCDIDPKCAKP